MRAIFSRVKLKEKQIWLLAVLVLFAAVAEMILPSLLAQMINSGVADSSRSTVLSLSAVMAGVTLLACIVNFLVCENRLPYFHRLFRNASRTGF